MKTYRIAAGACAVALLITGCSSTSKGSGGTTSTGSSSSSAGFPSPSESTTTGSTSGADNSGLVPADLNTKVLPAVIAQKTFHIKGSGDDGNGGTISFDIHYGSNGSQGTLGISGTTLQLLVVGSNAYMEGDASFWSTALAGQSTAGITAATVAGKWVKVNANGADFKDLFTLMDPKQLLDQSTNDTSTVSKVGNVTYQGQPAVEFKDSSDGSLIYIRRYGSPLPIAINASSSSSSGPGSFTFTDFGAPFTVSEPPASQVFDATPYLH